jgi:hypothetical protein
MEPDSGPHVVLRRSAVSSHVRPAFFNSRGAASNHYLNDQKLRQEHEHQLASWRQLAAGTRWGAIHQGHFDWYMFPIEDGSMSCFNVQADDVARLQADAAWIERYREGVGLVLRAWGWDVATSAPVQPLEKGMRWTNWDVRLAKIIRSLWLFEQKPLLESAQAFARHVKCCAVTRTCAP